MIHIHAGRGREENRRDAEAEDQQGDRDVGQPGALSELENADDKREVQQVLGDLRQDLGRPESIEVGIARD
jgi:hypothetical protein